MQSEAADAAGGALKLLADLAALFADPVKLQDEIKRYEAAASKAEKAEASLARARAKHDQHIAASTVTLDERRRKIVAQELDLRQRESMVEVSAERTRQTEKTLKARFGMIEISNSTGLVREYVDTSPEAADPHYPA
jgi:ribose 1,5-bisphosphokinase PhnN